MLKSSQIISLTLLLSLIFCDSANSQSEYPALNELMAQPAMQGSTVSLSIYDMESKKESFGFQANQYLLPASSIKSVTTLAALKLLGPDHCFKTRFMVDGELGMNGVWIGDVVVESDGDPTFLSPRFNQDPLGLISEWKLLLEGMGISGLKGQVLVLDEYFDGYPIADGVVNEDVGNYYGGGCFGFNCFDNTYSLEFSTTTNRDKAEFIAYKGIDPYLRFETEVGINSRGKDLAYVMGMPYAKERLVKGSLPARSASIEIQGAYPDPARAFANYLYSNLTKSGMKLIGKVDSERHSKLRNPKVLAEICSPSLEDIIYETNSQSINLYADAIFRHCGIALSGSGSYADSGKLLINFWKDKGAKSNGIVMQDGSGLSRSSLVNTEFIASALATASEVERDLLIRGFKMFEGKGKIVYYKSGYMSGVMAISGYLKSSDGKWESFAFVVNGHREGPSALRKEMASVLLQL